MQIVQKRLRILILMDQISGSDGGTEQHLSFLLKHLSEKFVITLVLLRDTGFRDKTYFPLQPIYLNCSKLSEPFQTTKSVLQLRRLIDERQIQMVYTFFPDSELIALAATCLGRNVPVIAARRNIGYWKNTFDRYRARLTSRLVTGIVANCIAVKSYCIEEEGVKANNIQVIYNPAIMDCGSLSQEGRVSKESLGIGTGDIVIGMVATLRPIKDHVTLLKAGYLSLKQCRNLKFLLVGGGEASYVEYLRNTVKKMGILERVIFAGKMSNATKVMELFDIGVLTSNSEGLSNTLIEYGAAGLATIATDVGGNPEVVVHCRTGYLVSRSDPVTLAKRIVEMARDDRTRKEYGKNAKVFVSSKFGMEHIVKSYETFFSETTKCNLKEGLKS